MLHVASHSYALHHSSSMRVLLSGMQPCGCSAKAPASQNRRSMKVFSKQQREVGCSELYNMTEAIKAQSQLDQSPGSTALPASSTAADPHNQDIKPSRHVEEPPATAAVYTNRGVDYYTGLVTTNLDVNNDASGADMLKRSLQLAGGVAGPLALLTYLFLASNNLV